MRPGDKVPVDGELIEGRSTLDESMVTGESMPVSKDVGAKVIGGTINRSGGFVMRAEKVGRDTMLARIVQMVATAQRSRAPIQRLADRVAGWFVPAVIAVAVLAFAAWATFGPEPRFAYGLVAAVTVLIIACPCALGLATPMSIMVGVGRGAQAGVLIRNAEALERMEAVDTLVARQDRHVDRRQAEGRRDQDRRRLRRRPSCLRLAASVERASEHPLGTRHRRSGGRTQDRACAGARLRFAKPARAPSAWSSGAASCSATRGFWPSSTSRPRSLEPEAERLRSDGATAIFVAIDGKLAGVIAIADPVKETPRRRWPRSRPTASPSSC